MLKLTMSSNSRNGAVILMILVIVPSFLIHLTLAGFACLENPCAHGICIDEIQGPHKCYCQNGFTGYSCEQNWDECRSWGASPCLNGGSCTDLIADFNCSCVEPFTGKHCEVNLNECDEIFPCQNNGTCVHNSREATHESGLMCVCPLGFKGDHCQEDVSMCNTTWNACKNGGKCIDDIGKKYYCQCERGWSGPYCEESVDECSSGPCQNGGVCVDRIGDYSCACSAGYTGKSCETKLKICPKEEDPCQNDALCLEELDQKVCWCVPDYHGKRCEERYDECDPPTKCLNGGTCIDGVGSFSCSCPPEFYGPTCECSIEGEENPGKNPIECMDFPHPSGRNTSTTSAPETRTDVNFSSLSSPPPEITTTASTSLSIADMISPILPTVSISTFVDLGLSSSVMISPTSILIMSSDSPYDPGGDSFSYFPFSPPPSSSSRFFSLSPTIDASIFSFADGIVQEGKRSSDIPMSSIPHSLTPTPALTATPIPTPTPTPSPSSALITTFIEDTATVDDTSYDPCPSLSVEDSETASVTGQTPPSSSMTMSSFMMTASMSLQPSEGWSEGSSSSVAFSLVPQSPGPGFSSSAKDLTLESEKMSSQFQMMTPSPTFPPASSTSSFYLMSSLDPNELISEFSPDFGITSTPTMKVSMSPSASLFDSESYWDVPDSSTPGILYPASDYVSISSSSSFSPHLPLPPFSLSTKGFQVSSEYSTPSASPTPSPSPSSWIFESHHYSHGPIQDEEAKSSLSQLEGSEKSTGFYTTAVVPTTSFFGESATFSPVLPLPSPAPSTIVVASSSEDLSSLASSGVTGEGDEQQQQKTVQIIMPTTAPVPSSSPDLSPSPSSTIVSPVAPSEGLIVLPTISVSSSPSPLPPTPSSSTSPSPLPPLPSPQTLTTTAEPTPSNLTDPCHNYCQNGASCISKNIEPICVCPFRYFGAQCEHRQEEIATPSFSGNSFMKYELPRASANIIEISAQMATVIPEGILMYSTIGKIYALLYIQNGLVTLHFSCGTQSMHFVETRTRVDNGYNFTISFRLENVVHETNELRCIGQVSLNESYSMQGEQIVDMSAMVTDLEQPVKKVFLGGLDNPDLYTNDDMIRIMPGFRGCVYRLQVNEELMSMYQEAKDGREISDCSTFGCVVNPCSGHSRCISSTKYPFWQCICPPGFEGRRCNIGICTVNPCKNGATCTTMPVTSNSHHLHFGNESSLTSLCLCPLGFTGARCQSRANITKPSFHVTPDYSSFVAYDSDIPRLADWTQLKFHFITRNMSQIALLLYQGSENSAQIKSRLRTFSHSSQPHHSYSYSSATAEFQDDDQATDFFFISFIHGFIALTWNLGSGTQRITTPSRVDNRLNVHTLSAGRRGKQAWLQVDGMRNTTGKTPGKYYQLDANSDIYIGGHESPRFEGLPNDLPLHVGFEGCIFDLGFRVKNKLFLPPPLRGRNINNCYEDC